MYEYLKFKENILLQCPYVPVDSLVSMSIMQIEVQSMALKPLYDILVGAKVQVICLDSRTITLRATDTTVDAIKPYVDDIHMQKPGEYIVYMDADQLMYIRMILKDTSVSPDSMMATSYANRIMRLIDMSWYRRLVHTANDIRTNLSIPTTPIHIDVYQSMCSSTLWPLYKVLEGRAWCMSVSNDVLTISSLDMILDLPSVVALLPDGDKAVIKGRNIILGTSLAQSILVEMKEMDQAMHPVPLDYIW